MFLKVLKFIQLPLVMIVIFTIGRFWLGLAGVPYAPRGSSTFSIVVLTEISAIYYGAMSGKIAKMSWIETALVGVMLGLFAQIMIFSATFASYALNLNTYFLHWDALNVKEGTVLTMSEGMMRRAPALAIGSIFTMIFALLGRGVFGFFVTDPNKN